MASGGVRPVYGRVRRRAAASDRVRRRGVASSGVRRRAAPTRRCAVGPVAAGGLIFLIAFCDAIVVLGILVPALPLLFAVGGDYEADEDEESDGDDERERASYSSSARGS